MLPKPLAFRDMGYITFQNFLIAFLGIFCQLVDILCISLISLFHYDMWAFKASFTVLLRPKCRWSELPYHKTGKIDQFGGGGAAALFSSRCPKNLQNEKISSTWKLLKLTWGVNFGSRRTILDKKTQFKVKPIFWG